MADLELALKLSAQDTNLRAEVRGARKDVNDLSESNETLGRSGRSASAGLDVATRGTSVFRAQALAANQSARAFTADMVPMIGAIQSVGGAAISGASQTQLLGSAALVAANETAALGSAALASGAQVAAMGSLANTSSAQVAAIGSTAMASSTGLGVLSTSAAAASNAVTGTGLAALAQETNILRIGRSTSLTAGMLDVFRGAANSSDGAIKLLGNSLDRSRSGFDNWFRSVASGRTSVLDYVRSLFQAEAQTEQLTQTSGRFAGVLNTVAKAAGWAAGLLGAISLTVLLKDMTQTIYEAEKLRGSLLSAVGGVPELADRAFVAIEQFAERTPFALDQSVQAFIKLQNLGIRPTEERLMGFGNVSAAMGKDLNQMIEAVADASTGEFERLKEFGIKASSEGDKVRFTFQGVTTTIGKNSEEIVNYLTNIGNQKFGDAMENQMNRLPGLWSNLKDTIDGIWRDMGDAGVTRLFSTWLTAGIGWTSDIRREIKAGWFDWAGAELDVLQARWGGWWDIGVQNVKSSVDLVRALWGGLMGAMGTDTDTVLSHLGNIASFTLDAVAQLPINLRAAVISSLGEVETLRVNVVGQLDLLINSGKIAWENLSHAADIAWSAIELKAAETVESIVQKFGGMVSGLAATLAEANSTVVGDALVSDTALQSLQQAGAALEGYSAASAAVRAEIDASNAAHQSSVSALEAERAGIEAANAVRHEAARQIIDDALAQRQEALANRDASIQEAEAKATASRASYEHKRAQEQERVSIDSVTEAMGGAAAAAATKATVTREQTDALNKLLDRLDPTRAATRQYNEDLELLQATLGADTSQQKEFNAAVAALDAEAAKASDALGKLLDRLDPSRAATRQYNSDLELLKSTLGADASKQKEFNAAVAALDAAAGKGGDALSRLLDRLNPARAATRQYNEDLALLEATLGADASKQNEFNAAVAALEVEANKSINGVLPLWEVLQTAWKRGVERMDDVASGWLKNFFLTGKISITGVKDLFLEMLAEMVYAAARNKIVLTFATAGSSSLISAGASAAQATGATVSSPLNLLSGGLSSVTSGVVTAGKNLYSAIGTITNDLGLFKISNMANAKMAATTPWSMAGDLAGGIAGGYLGSQVYGETSGLGAAAGGLAGSILIPVPVLGSAIGSFMGGAIEKGLSKLLGQKNDGNNAGFATVDLSTGVVDRGGVGKSYDQANIDQASRLAEELKAFAASIGGSSFAGRIDVGNKDGIKFQGQKFKDEGQFLQVAYREVIEQATSLDESLKDMLLGLTGSAQNLKRDASDAIALFNVFDADHPFFEGIAEFETTFSTLTQTFRREGETLGDTLLRLEGGLALLDAAGQDAARSVSNFERAAEVIDKVGIEVANNILFAMNAMGDGVRQQFQSLRDAAARNNMDVYETLVEQNRALIASYDGSIASSAALAQATEGRRQAELALLTELDAVTASVTGRISDFREMLILDGLDERGQYNRARDQISDLASQISTAGSASQVDSILSRIDALGKTAYGLLDDSGQQSARPEFLDWLDTIEQLATDRLGDLKDEVITTSEAVDQETQTAFWEKAGLAGENLTLAATDLQDSAQAITESAQESRDELSAAAADLRGAVRDLRDLIPQIPTVMQ